MDRNIDIQEWLRLAVSKNASDVHLLAGYSPVLRINGKLGSLDCGPVTAEDMVQILDAITSQSQREHFYRSWNWILPMRYLKETGSGLTPVFSRAPLAWFAG